MSPRHSGQSATSGERGTMGLFSTRDWNVIAVIFEKKSLYRVNGNRAKGSAAIKARDGAKTHPQTIYYAVFDQKRTVVESAAGKASRQLEEQTFERLRTEFPNNPTVQLILQILENAELAKAMKPFIWGGYPKDDVRVSS